MKPNRLQTLVTAVIAIACLATACGTTTDQGLPTEPFERTDGGSITLTENERPLVLNLWATWCAPCRAELPIFEEVASEVNDQVDIVGVNTGDREASARDLIAELELSFPQVLDERATVQRALAITGMPATIFVAPGGDVLDVHAGELNRGELLELLELHHDVR